MSDRGTDDELGRALAQLERVAGSSVTTARQEAAAVAAAVAVDDQQAAQEWTRRFAGTGEPLADAARRARPWATAPTPLLEQLRRTDPDLARDYAVALVGVATAACSLGELSVSAIGLASTIAAAQLGAVSSGPSVGLGGWTPTIGPPDGRAAGPRPSSPFGGPLPSLAGPTAASPAAPAPPVPAPLPADTRTLAELLAELDALIGLDGIKSEVHRQTEVLRIAALRQEVGLKVPHITRHLVFVGNPGTGKTTVARLVGGIYRAVGMLSQGQVIECDRSELVAGYVGQTALKTAAVVASAVGGVLFVDEAYALAGDEFGTEAIDTLVKEMEDHRDDLVVIVAGYPEPMQAFIGSNPGLESRFRLTLHFADYSDDQLWEIFASVCAEADFTPAPGCEEAVRTLLVTTPRGEGFGNGRFMRNLFEAAIVRQAWRLRDVDHPTLDQLRQLTTDDVAEPTPPLTPPEGAEPVEVSLPEGAES